MSDSKQYKILLVDDDERNLRVLKGILAPLEYDLREATNGADALALVANDPPDLILLDVMMPGMSGFEVCRQLKEDEQTHFIPIVLVTALTERESRIEGVEAGADDFLNKPVDVIELRTRVASLLRSKTFHDELQDRYVELKELEQTRESLTQMIVHDMRNPLTSLIGFAELLKQLNLIVDEERAHQYLTRVQSGAQTLMDMINTMMDLAKLEAGELSVKTESVVIEDVLESVVDGVGGMVDVKKLKLAIALSELAKEVMADREILRRILVNIVGNATDFSPQEGCITISSEVVDRHVKICVIDEGPGVPESYRERIFEKFGQIEGQRQKFSTGLGLTFCKLAIEAHGGDIGVDSDGEHGSCFWFTLPVEA